MKIQKEVLAAIWFVVTMQFSVGAVVAAIPESISYQGYLTDRFGQPNNETLQLTFRIYNVPTGGSPLWTDVQSVPMFQGLFSLELGSQENPFPVDLFDTPLWLGMTVESDSEMSPRRPFTSVAFAFEAEDAQTIQGQTLTDLQAGLAPGVRLMMGSESLGRVISYETSGDIPDFGAKVTLLTDTGLLFVARYEPTATPSLQSADGNNLFFSGQNCTGQAMIVTATNNPLIAGQGIAFMAGIPVMPFYIPRGAVVSSMKAASVVSAGQGCANFNGTLDAWPAFRNDPAATGLPDLIDGILVLE